jgi:DNA primase
VSSSSETREFLESFDLEYWFERESVAYKLGRGSSGMQINAQTCPACGDRRWRTYLNAETGRGNCFVCNETFSKQKFVHLTLGHDMESKADWRATYRHMEEVMGERGWRPRTTTTVAVDIGTVKLPSSMALPTKDGRNLIYLEERGITNDLAKYFHLRYCEKGWHNFPREDGTTGGQRFDGRVIIPVFDLDGECKTFQGRDVTGTAGDRKYLFPKGLPGTGRYLLNGQSAQRHRRVCMGEGAFDVMAIKKAFDENAELRDVIAVGSFGKHLSYGSVDGNDQLGRFRQLRNLGTQEVTIMWDGEWRALVSALDAAELLEKIGLKARIALLPADRDPNEVLPEVVRQAFWSAKRYSKGLSVKWRLRNPYTVAK